MGRHEGAGVHGWTRRRFLKTAAGGITLSMLPLSAGAAPFSGETVPKAPGWADNADGPDIRYRVDGFAKATGDKIYARDFRARDMDGWPDETSHALLLLAPDATRAFSGIDLSQLSDDLQPDRVVTAEDVAAAGFKVTGFFATDLFCAKGSTPAYLGHPVAILIWHDFGAFCSARLRLRGDSSVIAFGEKTAPATGEPYGSNRFTRVAGSDPKGPDVYSPVKDGWVGPVRYQKAETPIWAPAKPDGEGPGRATFYGDQIRKSLDDGSAGKVFEIEFETQSIDQVFMEPESGLAWHDTANDRLAAVFGVQSPEAILDAIAGMIANADAAHKVSHIDGHFAFVGGGFGGKDHTIFPLYLATAALFADGKPVRLALDRFQQFQFGLKRHAFSIKDRLAVDTETQRFTAFASDLVCNGGGLANFSASVADVGATAATSIYYLPKSDITTVAEHSRGVTAGSMRGYGTLQSMTAMECLVDEVARDLKADPFELRRKNALTTGQLNVTGNPASGEVRSTEVLNQLEKAPLWQNRAEAKTAYERQNSSKTYAVGMACVMKDFGTGADGVLASVTLRPDGAIEIAGNTIEMGTGISTAVAARAARHLGALASRVSMEAPARWETLKLETSGNPWGISQADQDKAAENPRWVPNISSPASASIGAHVNSEAVSEAAKVILRFGLWPAAQAIWAEGPAGGTSAGQNLTFEELRWVDGKLTGRGMAPLSVAQLAGKAHEMGAVTGAMVHAFNRWSWASADFEIAGESYTGAIDALAVQNGSNAWTLLDRTKVDFPPASFERIGVNYYAACGAVVALALDKTNGRVEVLDIHQVLECGTPLVPQLVSGISEGGIVMGLGQALHEFLPLYEDGPGNGTWNLNRYKVPHARDVPVWSMKLDFLPPISDTDPPKGMAEVVMIPIIPAVLNGLREATGHRFTKLPVSADDIMGVL